MIHRKSTLDALDCQVELIEFKNTKIKEKHMTHFLTIKRIIILGIVIIAGLILGRLAVRMFINLMVGGSLFGGNFL
ncbi:hypothetical protein [Oceanobacillus sp. 1P07AA]|uniref:hypothetical protein n=1 Tax=Oceanobacillus sp. 1P07AA TaxID=3132293 RepID=UPI0039A71A7D